MKITIEEAIIQIDEESEDYKKLRDKAWKHIEYKNFESNAYAIYVYNKKRSAFLMAVMALKKQIPIKPKDKKYLYGIGYGVCPKCGNGIHDSMKYCWICGQKIDWSEDNDNYN